MSAFVWIVVACAVLYWIGAASQQYSEYVDLAQRWSEPPPPPASKPAPKPSRKPRKVRPAANPLEATFEWDGRN
jgi:hypothetical protein